MQDREIFFMKEAIKEAKKAFQLKEVPVGAILVYKDKIIARGHNQVESLKDATAHAEMIAISSASEYLQNWRFSDVEMYSTLEPCPMCAGAMFLARIKRLVWGARDIKLGANGSFVDLFDNKNKHPFHEIEVVGGILGEEIGTLLKDFFKNVRKEKSSSDYKSTYEMSQKVLCNEDAVDKLQIGLEREYGNDCINIEDLREADIEKILERAKRSKIL